MIGYELQAHLIDILSTKQTAPGIRKPRLKYEKINM